MQLDSHKLLVGSGVPADSVNFNEYIQKNLKLYELNNNVRLNCHAAANFLRGEVIFNCCTSLTFECLYEFLQMASALRRGPYQTNSLLAGFDEDGPSLHFIDMYAALCKVNFGAHGHCSNFILSVFDRAWRPDMDEQEAIDVMKKCILELHTRFLISQPKFFVKIVDKNGVRVIEL